MSSESEKRCSMEELKKLNLPLEQTMPSTPAPCPTEEQWEELLALLDRQNRLLAAQSNMLNALLTTMQTVYTQAEKQTKELLNIRQQLEQVGRKSERKHLRLPRLHLSELPRPTLKGAALTLMVLVVSGILLYTSVTLWSVIRPLFQPLP